MPEARSPLDGAPPSSVSRKRPIVETSRSGPASSPQPDSEPTDASSSPKAQNAGTKPKRKKGPGKQATDDDDSSAVESFVPWPAHFTQLERLHKALNASYTFFCTRKHMPTTLDAMKGLVKSHYGREPSIDDVAQIASLAPRSIRFVYVDEEELSVNVSEVRDRGPFGRGREPTDPFVLADPASSSSNQRRHQVLLFEYIDSDLKRQVRNSKTGEPTAPTTTLRSESLKLPVYGQKQMIAVIEKRNKKFKSAVNEFLNSCAAKDADPTVQLDKHYLDFVPVEHRDVSPSGLRAELPREIPQQRKSISEIIEEIKSLEWYTDQIVPDGHRAIPPQSPVYGELEFALSQSLVDAIYNAKGIERLYSHQAEAINNLFRGNNVIISTSTSSGKSLIYQLPVLHELEKDPETRAMYIFPTKALAQDQRRSLKELLRYLPGLEDVMVETFDGDTPMPSRNEIRDNARVIFTNPDMLHLTILPHEEAWRQFLRNLKFVVVDELHIYNGLFGSHVAFVMRRLRRICAAVGNRNVKFISCSATVANPEQHMKTIFGVDQVKLTDTDGSPSGGKEFICWNTPFKDPKDKTSGRGNSFQEGSRLFCQLVLRGVRTIAFTRTRQACEAFLSEVKKELTMLNRQEVGNRVMSYRGGYTPHERRGIEQEMFEGKLVGIIATTALELGVDIGSLDAVLSIGFPYTIANLRQQSGRAGRRNKDSLSVLVGQSFPTDQFFMSNPDELFTRPNCELQVDLENILVLEAHMQCAAHEMPLLPDADAAYFGTLASSIAAERMRKDADGFYHCSQRFLPFPAKHVAIRDTEETHFAIVDITNGRNVVLEDLEGSRAFFTVYEGGIFMHQGMTYVVKEFSQERMMAKVERVTVSWTTQQRDYTDIDPVETEIIRKIPDSQSRAFMGSIKIKQVVFGFFKIDARGRILDAVQVDNDPIILHSKGFWLDVPKSALDILIERRLNVSAAIHASEHAILSLLPNFVISMPGDVKTECKLAKKEFSKKETTRKRPARLTFYDSKGGSTGSGISMRAFEHIDLLLRQATERISSCHCLEGCLECCCSEICRDMNQVISKAGAEVVLRSLLNWEIDVDALPMGPEEFSPVGVETVIPAIEVLPARGKTREMIELS
jgi:DEAD/DEAH box helicase domain-containing protein